MFRTVLLTFFFLTSLSAAHAEEICNEPNLLNLTFMNAGLEAVAFDQPSIITSQGLEIDSESCILGNGQTELVVEVQRSDAKGLRCLSQLAANGGAKAADHLQKLADVRQSGARIICELQEGAEITPDLASSSTQFLSVPSEYRSWNSSEREAFLFHEQFHLLGHSHESGTDYATDCESCCFGNATPDLSSASCRSCGGSVP